MKPPSFGAAVVDGGDVEAFSFSGGGVSLLVSRGLSPFPESSLCRFVDSEELSRVSPSCGPALVPRSMNFRFRPLSFSPLSVSESQRDAIWPLLEGADWFGGA